MHHLAGHRQGLQAQLGAGYVPGFGAKSQAQFCGQAALGQPQGRLGLGRARAPDREPDLPKACGHVGDLHLLARLQPPPRQGLRQPQHVRITLLVHQRPAQHRRHHHLAWHDLPRPQPPGAAVIRLNQHFLVRTQRPLRTMVRPVPVHEQQVMLDIIRLQQAPRIVQRRPVVHLLEEARAGEEFSAVPPPPQRHFRHQCVGQHPGRDHLQQVAVIAVRGVSVRRHPRDRRGLVRPRGHVIRVLAHSRLHRRQDIATVGLGLGDQRRALRVQPRVLQPLQRFPHLPQPARHPHIARVVEGLPLGVLIVIVGLRQPRNQAPVGIVWRVLLQGLRPQSEQPLPQRAQRRQLPQQPPPVARHPRHVRRQGQ